MIFWKWNFNHTCGVLNGKHVKIRRSGNIYYNYKEFFSCIMLGWVGVDYNISNLQRKFNYRLSLSKRVVEKALGILLNKLFFCVCFSRCTLQVKQTYVKLYNNNQRNWTCLCIHNLLGSIPLLTLPTMLTVYVKPSRSWIELEISDP